MPYELRLPPPEARLVALALAYHLGRPGSEIDPATLQVRRLGLAMPAAILKAQQGLPEAKLTLELDQLMRLKNAMLQTISELKVISMSEAPWTPGPGSGHSVNEAFEQALAAAFPTVREEPTYAQTIAASLMQLVRQVAEIPNDPAARPSSTPLGQERPAARQGARSRPWWRIWGRD